MRFHCLGRPDTITNDEYIICAFTQKLLKFCKMMKARGHTVIHYGHEDSNLDCTEHVTVVTNKDFEIAYGHTDSKKKDYFKYSLDDHVYQTFYKNAIKEIDNRKQKHDFILAFWGHGVREICDAHKDLIVVEPSIGYASGHWAKWKIFESYAIFHAYYGLNAIETSGKLSNYDMVIPAFFDPTDFIYNKKKEDYFLYLGRITNAKGVNIAEQVTREIGAKLIIAGSGSLKDCGYKETPSHVTEFGRANKEQRKKLMAGAKGAFVASQYLEPFGWVQIEMLMSGTPTITTDWGAFVENNIHGLTGYRCRTFEQYCWAAKNIHKIKPEDCRKWAMRFTLDRIAPMYEEYFTQILDVYTGKGWYEKHPERKNLSWHDKGMLLNDKIEEYATIKDQLSNNIKSNNYKLPFSKIYYINLKKSVDRNNHIKKIIKNNNLNSITERIEAIYGKELIIEKYTPNIITEKAKNKILSDNKSFGLDMTHGALGLAVTFKKVLSKIIKDNQITLILEDDIDEPINFIENLNLIELPNDFDILYLGCHGDIDLYNYIKSNCEYYNKNIKKLKNNTRLYGTFSMILSPKGAKNLLKIFPLDYQIDTAISHHENLNRYITGKKIIYSPESQDKSARFKSEIQITSLLELKS